MARSWRRFAFLLAASILSGSVLISAALVGSLAAQRSKDEEIANLRVQATRNDDEAQCRARVAFAAQDLESRANSFLRQGLADSILAGRTEGLAERAREMTSLNASVNKASDLRTQSLELCAANPAFTPPP